LVTALAAPLLGQSPATLNVDVSHAKAAVSPTLYGLMTEEINYSYDGGLYAELVRNRTFRSDWSGILNWFVIEKGTASAKMSIDPKDGPSTALPNSAKLEVSKADANSPAGLLNEGYWAIAVRPNSRYTGSFFAKSDSAGPLPVRIALVAAVSATVLSLWAPTLSWLAAGFFAAYLYCRKTGFRLDVLAGVKIGWITGLILYGFSAVVFTAQQLPDALAGHPGKTLLEELQKSSFQNPEVMQEMTHMAQTDPGKMILLLLVAMFVVVTCLSMAGGALGAKLVGSPK